MVILGKNKLSPKTRPVPSEAAFGLLDLTLAASAEEILGQLKLLEAT